MNTPFLDGVYDRLNFDRELVFKFFAVFSLFEYALKQSGYIPPESTKVKRKVEADWTRFVKDTQGKFDPSSSPALKEAVSYLLTYPPMKQKIENGDVVFKRSAPNANSTDTEKLSIYIRRVRNNLFHGGKANYQRPRDTELIQHSIVILESWSQLDRNVQQAFIHAI